MNAKQFFRASYKDLRSVLLYEAGFTQVEIAKREGTSQSNIYARIRKMEAGRGRTGRPKIPVEIRELPTWRKKLHERLRGFGMTTAEASWLLSIKDEHHVSTLEKPNKRSPKAAVMMREDTCTFRITLSAWTWLEAERAIVATAILDGADDLDIAHLLKIAPVSAGNYRLRLRHKYGFRTEAGAVPGSEVAAPHT